MYAGVALCYQINIHNQKRKSWKQQFKQTITILIALALFVYADPIVPVVLRVFNVVWHFR
jgi:hypothetical protein